MKGKVTPNEGVRPNVFSLSLDFVCKQASATLQIVGMTSLRTCSHEALLCTRDDDIEPYERDLSKARRAACAVATFHVACNFLGFCVLTWAALLLLLLLPGSSVHGGFPVEDFYGVSCLLFLQALHFASTFFSTKLFKMAPFMLSQNPVHLKLQDNQFIRNWVARILDLFQQVLLIILPSIVFLVYRFSYLQQDYPCNIGAQKSAQNGAQLSCTNNLQASLRIFYVLVLSNAAVSSLALLCSAIVLKGLHNPVEHSILRYYDEMLQRSLDKGIFQADDFEFFQFAYTTLGRDFSRNVQPLTVWKHHRKLIRYLYAHRHGIDAVLLFFDWPNCFVQQAAACMVGFWIDEKSHGLPVTLPASVTTKLADKLGTGQVGWTAANSVDCLAKWDPDLLLHTKNSRGVHVVDSLIDMIDPSTSRSLVFVRVLISLFKCLDDMDKPEEFLRNLKQMFESKELERKLKEMLQGSKVQRLRVLAGYLLMRMGKLQEEDGSKVGNIKPDRDGYFHRSEVHMLNDLVRTLHLPPIDWFKIQSERFAIREEEIWRA